MYPISKLNYMLAKILEFDWLQGMQLIRNCTGQIRAKIFNRDFIGCFCLAKSCNCYDWLFLSFKKLVIVRDWIILAVDDSIAFDFQTPSSIFHYNNNQWCSVVYRVLDQRRVL